MVGDLPQDFLRVEASAVQQQVLADQQTAAMLQAQQGGMSFLQGGGMPRLSITLVQVSVLPQDANLLNGVLQTRWLHRVSTPMFEHICLPLLP